MRTTWEEAIAVIGNDAIVTRDKERAADLGLRTDKDGNFQGFGDYMHAKVNKLKRQVHDNVVHKSTIFKGLSFYVDGHTHPCASDIRTLVTTNGGEYHHYYLHGTTTYVVAESLANTKIERLRKDEKVIKPTFITASIAAGKVVPEADHFLIKVTPTNHVNEFFHKSRLHLISTMAKEFKKFVSDMRANSDTHEFTGREKLHHLKSSIKLTAPIICHIDMDCFFVSVTLRTRPDLIGKPVAVTHSSAKGSAYGEIASCSYEARKKGCYARQFVRDALKSCPDLICVPYEFDAYVAVAKQLYTIISKYTLQIKAVSCDELYFDLGSICQECEISDPLALITIIRNDIYEQTQCVASAGLGPNSLIARMATKKAKPKGQLYVTAEEAKEFILDFPITDLPTIGWSTNENIHEQFGANIKTCRQLHQFSIENLRNVLGYANGEKVYRALRGICEPIDFDENIDQKSCSVNVNFGIRLKCEADLKHLMKNLSTSLSSRLNAISKTGTCLSVKLLIRKPDAPIEPAKYGAHGPCDSIRKQMTIVQTSDADTIYNGAMKMIKDVIKPEITDIRGLAIFMTKLILFAPDRITAVTRNPGTLWDFMKTKNITKTSNGITTTDLTAFEWVPKVKPPPGNFQRKENSRILGMHEWSPIKEQDEMRMKISDVCKTIPHQPIPARKLGKLPSPPIRPEHHHKMMHRRVAYNRAYVTGVLVQYLSKPTERTYRTLLFHLKNFVTDYQIGNLKRMVKSWEQIISDRQSPEEWKYYIAAAKRYLNWYSYNHLRSKIYYLEEDDNDEEEFAKFQEDILQELNPKDRRERSPDLFARSDDEDPFNETIVAAPDSQECIVVGEGNDDCLMVAKVSASKPIEKGKKKPTTSRAKKPPSDKPGLSTSRPPSRTKKNLPNLKNQQFNSELDKRKQLSIDELWKNPPQIQKKKQRLSAPSNDDDCVILDYQPGVISVD